MAAPNPPSYEQLSGRDRFFRILAEEYKLLVDPATQDARAEFTQPVSCYLCGGNDERELFRKQGFRFVQCKACLLAYVNPRLTAAAIDRFYEFESAANDAWMDVLLSPAEEEFQSLDFASLLDDLRKLNPPGRRLLDIGCSIGRLMSRARDAGFEPIGIELNDRARKHAASLGFNVTARKLGESGFPPASFDVITLIETLEHLPAPREILAQCLDLLRPGGILLVGVPNFESLGAMVLHEQTRTFTGRNHLVYYSERTLSRLLRESGFEVAHVRTDVSLLNAVLNHGQFADPHGALVTDGLPAGLRRIVEDPAARQALERLICDHGLGYRLRIFARRPLQDAAAHGSAAKLG